MPLRYLLCFCAIALTAAPLLASEGEWPQFRGPGGQGISNAVDVPVEWNANKNVAWKIEIPGKGWSSPVVADGKVYLTTAADKNGGPVSLWAICIDADSGKVLWDTNVFTPDPAAVRAMHPKNSPASATPIVTADRLYVHFGHLGTAALDLTGKIIWRENALKYSPVHGNGGSPALIKDTLIFTCDGARDPFVAALDANSGKLKWTTPRNSPARKPFSFSTPLQIEVDGATQAVIPGSGFVGGYDPASGHELWRVLYGEGYSVVPRPVFSHGLLFLSSGFDSPVMYAIKPAGAKGDVTRTNVAWTQRKGAPLTPSMLVVGDELYSVSDGGIATCANLETGKPYWTQRLEGNFSASPVFADGRIYFQSEAGVGFVIKAGKTFALLSQDDLSERSLASDAVIDHALFIRTERHLWKIAVKK
ncbi:MAG TPA: PQQ-binding-like beta-propeller repeat protein [Tepidisphaeraceae bacterium]|nr:PQQ-binding-like beta-propeller repeat protein [Tepidisphaeraceae bacterium]